MLYMSTFFLQTLRPDIHIIPFKITRDRGNSAKSHSLAVENTIDITTAAKRVSKYTVNRMKRQINPNYAKQLASRRPVIPPSVINSQYHSFQILYWSTTKMC